MGCIISREGDEGRGSYVKPREKRDVREDWSESDLEPELAEVGSDEQKAKTARDHSAKDRYRSH